MQTSSSVALWSYKNLNQANDISIFNIFVLWDKLSPQAVYCEHLDNKMLHSQDLCDCDLGIFSIPTLTSSLARHNVVLDSVRPANRKRPYKRLSLVTLQSLLLKPGGTTAAAARTHTSSSAKWARGSLTGSSGAHTQVSFWWCLNKTIAFFLFFFCCCRSCLRRGNKSWQTQDKKWSSVGSTLPSVAATIVPEEHDISFSLPPPPVLKWSPFMLNTRVRDSLVQQISFLFLIASPNPSSIAIGLSFKV